MVPDRGPLGSRARVNRCPADKRGGVARADDGCGGCQSGCRSVVANKSEALVLRSCSKRWLTG